MGVYVYTVTRKKVAGHKDIAIAKYAYKPYHSCVFSGRADRDNDRMYARYVAPSERAWERSGEDMKFIVFDYDMEALRSGEATAAPIYVAPNHVGFYDSAERKYAGVLAKAGRGYDASFLPVTDTANPAIA